MKKKILSLFALMGLAFLSLNAQTNKGQWLIGATTSGFSFAGGQNQRLFNANLNPSVGYFVAQNLAAGLRVGANYSATKDYNDEKYRNYGVSFSAFGRYYIPLTQRLKIPIDVRAGIGTSTFKHPSIASNNSNFTFGAHTGLSCFLNPKVSLDFLVGYSGVKTLNDPSQRVFGGIDGQLGFSVYLDGKSKSK